MATQTPQRRRWRAMTVAGVSVAALGITGLVTTLPGATPPARADGLEPFAGCHEVESFFRESTLPQVTAYGLDPYAVGDGAVLRSQDGTVEGSARNEAAPQGDALAAAPAPGEAATGPAVGSGSTGTNVQEEGVDEPDLAKTDGRHLFTVSGGVLHVVDTADGRPRAVGRLDLPVGQVSEMLLAGDRALLLGSGSARDEPGNPSAGDVVPLPRPTTTTRVTLVDLTDPARPRVLSTADLDGTYVTAREHDGVVRLVVASQPDLALRYAPRPGAAEGDALAHNRRVVRRATATDWLPHAVVRDAAGRTVSDDLLVDCADVHRPREDAGLGTVSIVTVDPAQGLRDLPATAVTTGSEHVYASASRLYVATGAWALGGPLGDDVAVDSTRSLVRPRGGGASTALHAFDITGDGAASYVASGSVDGWLLGRWALSEYEGRLRVATTRDSGASDNQVVVLAERGDRLVRVGGVGGLGRGETIRSVRWFGDLATVVTFRQTDPLYTLDLSDPEHPRVLGALKVRGFSSYLHPVGGGLLLGVGQDATAQGQVSGLQVSSFDVSDLADPRRVDALGLGAGWSPVLDDSRAFTYLPDQRLALVPVESWGVALPQPVEPRPAEPGSEEPGTDPSAAGVAPEVAPPAPTGGVVAVRVGTHGALTSPARLGEGTPVVRAVPVGGQIALVGPSSLVLVDTGSLTETGRVALA